MKKHKLFKRVFATRTVELDIFQHGNDTCELDNHGDLFRLQKTVTFDESGQRKVRTESIDFDKHELQVFIGAVEKLEVVDRIELRSTDNLPY